MDSGTKYTLYTRRWFVLLTLAFLNLSNNALWISYSAVADVTGEYFKISADDVDLLGTISFIVGIPMCLGATYIVNSRGFKTGIYCGSVLTLMGGLVRGLSTLPGLNQNMDLKTQYYLSLVGQALTGLGNPFAVSLPTKVSQNWFGEKERGLATGALAMSLPLGIVMGQGISPVFVKQGDDIPLMNIVWFVPALLTQLMVFFMVTTSNPPSPPSQSSELGLLENRDSSVKEYLKTMKSMFMNVRFMVLFLVVGGAVGFFNVFSTQLSQFMCSRGYENTTSGITGSLLLGTGFIGAIASGLIVEKYGYIEEVSKLFYGISGIFAIIVCQFMRYPDSEVWIHLFASLFGVFGFGMYPLGLELSVEVTYPVDESIGTALIFLSGQLQGGILVLVSSMLEQDLTPAEQELSVCNNSIQPKDHTRFLLTLSGLLTTLVVVFVLCFKTKFKRKMADIENINKETIT